MLDLYCACRCRNHLLVNMYPGLDLVHLQVIKASECNKPGFMLDRQGMRLLIAKLQEKLDEEESDAAS